MINVPIKGDRFGIANAVNRMFEIPDIWFYVVPDELDEVSDAIEKHEYFKAFTLCVSLYESYGKAILISQFKGKLSLKPKRMERLEVNTVIIMLYTHGLIGEGVYSDMIDVNDTRIDFIHRYLSAVNSDQVASKIKENIPKIRRSLEALKQIYDKLPKEQ